MPSHRDIIGSPDNVWPLVSAYKSQIQMFMGDKQDFLQYTKEYTQQILLGEDYAERYWKLL